ncbi:unnamed protein product, partial [Linum tenue]
PPPLSLLLNAGAARGKEEGVAPDPDPNPIPFVFLAVTFEGSINE